MPSRISPPPLPAELNDLVTLHSSFLTAVSLHYAHNGTSTPVDLRMLAPSISSVWGKRRVTLEDVRLCIGIMSSGLDGPHRHPFCLSDYGEGKICLELDDQEQKLGFMARHVDENTLHGLFTQNLGELWQSWRKTQGQAQQLAVRPIAQLKKRGRPRKTTSIQITVSPPIDSSTISDFFAQLPQAEITTCSSLSKVAPLREKGRKRLRDLKDSAEQARTPKKTKASPIGKENEPAAQPTQTKITEFATTRKTNLLDRILAKQALAASLPNTPSTAELQRKAALQRAEEVLSVLSLLAAGKAPGQRVSFSMAALVQSLQGSVRSPISKEEAMRCVEVLANEVVPGYVGLVKMGAMQSVVVNQAARPADLRMRLISLGVECL